MENNKPKLKIKINSDVSDKIENIQNEKKKINIGGKKITTKKEKEKKQETENIQTPLWFRQMEKVKDNLNRDYIIKDKGSPKVDGSEELGYVGQFLNRRKI